MEFWYGANPLGDQVITEALHIENGYLRLLAGAGLGITIREDVIRQHVVEGWVA